MLCRDKDNKEVVASAVTVNIEKVLSLKPDMVIATGMTDPEAIELIRKAGIKPRYFRLRATSVKYAVSSDVLLLSVAARNLPIPL